MPKEKTTPEQLARAIEREIKSGRIGPTGVEKAIQILADKGLISSPDNTIIPIKFSPIIELDGYRIDPADSTFYSPVHKETVELTLTELNLAYHML